MAEQCDRHAFGGGRCELDAGHDGKHYRAWPDRDGGFEWTDKSQAELVDRYSSRFD
ncbi:hypothetical protein [Mycobacterium sp. SMC-4]|uniref:hypothetical protein n=1 Tax=Mycobacterium sp. SMC-4 TaxID=2857059 RepID=UPI0021B4AC97|nr:hypothetical protein [Mycobacterium sp. SMC-4]UXA19516.1 hypothetical protein KXD98_07925 [Mycobacterium sp. SMC-4]